MARMTDQELLWCSDSGRILEEAQRARRSEDDLERRLFGIWQRMRETRANLACEIDLLEHAFGWESGDWSAIRARSGGAKE